MTQCPRGRHKKNILSKKSLRTVSCPPVDILIMMHSITTLARKPPPLFHKARLKLPLPQCFLVDEMFHPFFPNCNCLLSLLSTYFSLCKFLRRKELTFTVLRYSTAMMTLFYSDSLAQLFSVSLVASLLQQGASLVVQTVKNLPAMHETWVQSLSWEDPLEKGMAIHSSILAWRIS